MKNLAARAAYAATFSLVSINAAFADELDNGIGAAKPDKTNVPESLTGANGVFETVANILIFLTGAIAVIVLIFGGLRYVTSTGDAARVKQAKDTILYGIVGLVVAILAYALVKFVAGALTK